MSMSELHISELELDIPELDDEIFLPQTIVPEEVTNFEMAVNPHFKNWDPMLNLKKLKSSVHQIIKVCGWFQVFL